MKAYCLSWWLGLALLCINLPLNSQITIDGPTEVCPNTATTYSVNGNLPSDAIYLWTINGGSFTGLTNVIDVTFVEEPSNLSVTVISEGYNETASLDISLETLVYNLDYSKSSSDEKRVMLICAGQESPIDVTMPPGSTLEWETPDEITITGSNGEYAASSTQLGSYFITLSITSTSGCVFSETIEVKVKESPSLEIASEPAATNGVISTCLNQSILFEAQSNSTLIQWDFGDGEESSGTFATHNYDTPGTYIVSATPLLNDCSSTVTIEVIVEDGAGITVECLGPTCSGDQSSYCATGGCDSYNWVVTGGTLISGQGSDCIDVQWDNPESGFGTLSIYGDNCNVDCGYEGFVVIPLIGATGLSTYNENICVGSTVYVSSNNPFGLDYTYEVSPEGFDVIYEFDSGIYVRFNEPGTYTIAGIGSNPLFNCTVESSIEINALEPATIMVADACSGQDIQVSISPGSTNTDPASFRIWNGSEFLTEEFTGTDFVIPGSFSPGNYSLNIIPNEDNPTFCPGSVLFEVGSVGEVESINGAELVCPGQLYSYQATVSNPSNQLDWTLTGGQFNGGGTSYTGQSPQVIWSSNGTISVTATDLESGCVSEAVSLNPMLLNLDNFEIQGPTATCNSSVTSYSLSGANGQPVTWSLSSNVGSIISGQFSNVISVNWSFLEEPETVTLTVALYDCEGNLVTTSIDVEVTPTPAPNIEGPDLVCPDEEFSLLLTGIDNAASVYATFSTGETVFGVQNEISINLSDLDLQEVNTPGLKYLVITVVDPNGCIGQSQVQVEFEVSVEPELSLTSLEPNCQPCDESLELTMNLSSQLPQGGFADYEFRWFFIEGGNGTAVEIASNQNSLTVFGPNALGIYYVQAENLINGCVTESNPLVFQCGENSVIPIGEADIEITLLEQGENELPGVVQINGSVITGIPSDQIPFENGCGFDFVSEGLSIGEEGNNSSLEEVLEESIESINEGDCNYYYVIYDPVSGNQLVSTEPDFTTVFDVPGYYPIQVWVGCNVDGTIEWSEYLSEIIIPYIPSFEYSIECDNRNGKYTVNFFNTSLYLDGIADVSDMWVLDGDMAYPGSSDLSVNLYPGEHCMRFAIFSEGFPTYFYEECFTLDDIPENIIAVTPQVGCENTVFNFSANYTGEIIQPLWDFGDGTQSIQLNPQKTFALTGNSAEEFTISFSFQSIYGCTYTDEVKLTILPSDLTGNIEVVEPDCALNPLELAFVPNLGEAEDYTYLWNTGETNPSISVDASGVYFVYVFDGDCAYFSTINVAVQGTPNNVVNHPASSCQNSSVLFTSANIEDAVYSWNIGGMYYSNQNPQVWFPTNGPVGNVDVNLIIEYGNCSYEYSGVIEVLASPDSPNIEIENNGDCDNLLITLSTGNNETQWSTGEIGSDIIVEPGTYYASIINDVGCVSNWDYVNVQAPSLPSSWLSGCYEACLEDIIANPVSIGIGNNTTVYFNGEAMSTGSTLVLDGIEDAGSYVLESCGTIGEGENAIECCVTSAPLDVTIGSCEADCTDIEILPEGVECIEQDGQPAYEFRICLVKDDFELPTLSFTNGTFEYNQLGGGGGTGTYPHETGTMFIYDGVFFPADPSDTEMCYHWIIPFDNGNKDYQEYLAWVAAGNTPEASP